MSVDLAHIRQIMAEADCLYAEAEVEAAIDAMAATINSELAERNPVVFCVMNGGLIFSGKLVPKLKLPPGDPLFQHPPLFRQAGTQAELPAGALLSTRYALSQRDQRR